MPLCPICFHSLLPLNFQTPPPDIATVSGLDVHEACLARPDALEKMGAVVRPSPTHKEDSGDVVVAVNNLNGITTVFMRSGAVFEPRLNDDTNRYEWVPSIYDAIPGTALHRALVAEVTRIADQLSAEERYDDLAF